MEVWDWKLITENTQLANDRVFIKSIFLDHSAATVGGIFYNEEDNSETAAKKFITIRVTAENLTKFINFTEPCQLDNGCYINWTAGTLIVQFRHG